jgi:hypothetical protein
MSHALRNRQRKKQTINALFYFGVKWLLKNDFGNFLMFGRSEDNSQQKNNFCLTKNA